MKSVHVNTKNTARFLAALSALRDRGAAEACFMVVDGEPGQGKTAVLEWWATQQGAVFLRAKKEWTPAWMMRELLGTLAVSPAHSFERMFAQALQTLGGRAVQAEREGLTFAVVVDEVDHIVRRAELLETLRDLSDMLEIPFILVGMGWVRSSLSRFPQVASRVGQYVEFAPADLDDVRAMVKGLCEVPVRDDLVGMLHRLAVGRVREIKEGIKAIERHGSRNKGKEVGVVEMAGQPLLNDRATGRPILVRVEG